MKVKTSGLPDFEDRLAAMPEKAVKAAVLATNAAATKAAVWGKREVISQVAFPKRYLDDKLKVVSKANANNIEAVVRGEFQARSLASFAANKPKTFAKFYKIAPRLRIKPTSNAGSFGTRMFFLALRQGQRFDEEAFNVGLAVRLKKGEQLRNTTGAVKATKIPNVYLLYGPSVNQVFQTVAPNIAGDVANYQATEFERQFRRLDRG